jgi:tRNA G46 methylase TrmB
MKIVRKIFHPSSIVRKAIVVSVNAQVCSSPFSGAKGFSKDFDIIPYLLGTHELELHSLIEELCKHPFDVIINVGAGKGYYAVGMVLRNPKAQIIAFECIDRLSGLLKENAMINKVGDRINIQGFCDGPALNNSIPEHGNCLIASICI